MSARRIVIGSSSTWRKSLAEKTFGQKIDFTSADIDEKAVARSAQPKTPSDHTQIIARAKLQKLFSELDPNEQAVVMCFDTVIVSNNEILEKPRDRDHAISMIKMWAKPGNKITIYTAICMGTSYENRKESVEHADFVIEREIKDEELPEYLNSSGCMNTSGSMVVSVLSVLGIGHIEGDQDIIEGFPVKKVTEFYSEL